MNRNVGPTMRLQETVGYMLQNYQENIQMSKLAELGQVMDKTPMSYITDLRINKAKELLLTTDKPVSDIVASVGYNDEFYFSRRFKEKSGYSPSVFTQKRELKTISLSSPYTDHLFTLGSVNGHVYVTQGQAWLDYSSAGHLAALADIEGWCVG
ncbi:helix-turn-helix transcriptional regulator [Cohnella fermenti]|nr:helix-turn-helix transcriptional regulator [Cohnella fermenti]